MSRPYLRYQSPSADLWGRHVGIFALVNGLHDDGALTADEEHYRTTTNAWYDDSYPNPTSHEPSVYDRSDNPLAASCFKTSAVHLISRLTGHLEILDAHDVAWERVVSPDPGRILYEDPFQVVVVPRR